MANNRVTFTSRTPFQFEVKHLLSSITGPAWEGTMEICLDGSGLGPWSTLSEDVVYDCSPAYGGNYFIHLRGTGNSHVSGVEIGVSGIAALSRMNIYSSGFVDVQGGLWALLDYTNPHAVPGKAAFMGMFQNCTRLRNISVLTFPETCTAAMFKDAFYGCTGLETPWKTIEYDTIPRMAFEQCFIDCTSLKTAPDILSNQVNDNGCCRMFQGCSSLKYGPILNPTRLDRRAYASMFYGCTSLVNPTAILPAYITVSTTTASWETPYNSMFHSCVSLTSLPKIMALDYTGEGFSLYWMFAYCRSLGIYTTNTAEHNIPFRFPYEGTGTGGAQSYTFAGTQGDAPINPTPNTTYYYMPTLGFSKQPVSATWYCKPTSNLLAIASGSTTEEIHYTWQIRGTDNSWNDIPLTDDPEFDPSQNYVGEADVAETHEYRCKATCGSGSDEVIALSDVVTITLQYFDFITLVLDRTLEDTQRIYELLEKWRNGTLTMADRLEWQSYRLKGAYNYTDMNRVGNALKYIKRIADSVGKPITYSATPKVDWTFNDVPTQTQMSNYISNVGIIKSQFAIGLPNLPSGVKSYEDANDIEKILYQTKDILYNWLQDLPQASEDTHNGGN